MINNIYQKSLIHALTKLASIDKEALSFKTMKSALQKRMLLRDDALDSIIHSTSKPDTSAQGTRKIINLMDRAKSLDKKVDFINQGIQKRIPQILKNELNFENKKLLHNQYFARLGAGSGLGAGYPDGAKFVATPKVYN